MNSSSELEDGTRHKNQLALHGALEEWRGAARRGAARRGTARLPRGATLEKFLLQRFPERRRPDEVCVGVAEVLL
ncbi:hypothetical protein EYF80_057625 [Liparis tanakae]|uniref:Uncharacterized protein n=1 Tax=Liparis tanakae TaxID=230148 RepID=A0A4Z2EV25_9TELE|nr:hypothetical protein EYF80_057625 [Liparis tanakae]